MTKAKRQNVSLPFEMPRYSSYHWLADAGVPAKNNPTSDVWYFNNTVPIHCNPALFQVQTFYPNVQVARGNIWDLPFLEKVHFQSRFVKNCSREIIQSLLEQGFYAHFWGADDYYIPGKSWYKRKHLGHDGLLCGVDNDTGEYSLAAFDTGWRYCLFQTTQRGVAAALKQNVERQGWGELVGVKCDPNYVVELDVPLIKKELEEYLSAPPFNRDDTTTGISVHDALSEYLDTFKAGETPHERSDRRIFRMMWEHKSCMLDRIKAVEAHCGLDDEISAEYATLVELSDQIRFIYMKYCSNRNDRLIDGIQELLREVAGKEAQPLSRLCEKI